MRVGSMIIPEGEYGVLDIRAKYAVRTWTDARDRITDLQIFDHARMLVAVTPRSFIYRWFLVAPLFRRLLRA